MKEQENKLPVSYHGQNNKQNYSSLTKKKRRSEKQMHILQQHYINNEVIFRTYYTNHKLLEDKVKVRKTSSKIILMNNFIIFSL